MSANTASEAAESIAPAKKQDWLHQQQGLLLENKAGKVLQTLELHFEPFGQEPAPVRAAHQYIDKRKDNLDYAGAKAQDLPDWVRGKRERTPGT